MDQTLRRRAIAADNARRAFPYSAPLIARGFTNASTPGLRRAAGAPPPCTAASPALGCWDW